MKVIGAAFASLLLLPVLVLGAFAGWGVSGTPSGAGTPQDESELIAVVLTSPSIGFTPAAEGDVRAGRVDARILAILLAAAEEHTLDRVGPITTGHSYYVKGTTRVSNHVSGRAVDILAIDGAPVSPSNSGARALMAGLLEFPPPLKPDELGGPWVISVGSRSSFTDAMHVDHVHIGFDA